MKDFQDIINQQTNFQQVQDPFKYTTPQVEEQLKQYQMSNVFKLFMGSIIATGVVAPLQTISTSLQLSVLHHKHIHQTPQMRTKQLAKLNTQLTLHEKGNLQLMIRTGGQFMPYTAPVYESYAQTAKNLMKQGWKSFFKGLTFRIAHNYIHFYPYAVVFRDAYELEQNQGNHAFLKIIGKLMGIQALMDLGFNFLHVLQNRYILQNNIPQFKVFRSTMRATAKIWQRGQFKLGCTFHILNSMVQLFLRSPSYLCLLSMNEFSTTVKILYYFAQLLIYPWSTAFKRVVCQSAVIPGMIPIRYQGLWHAFKVIGFQEGIKGLYKGFGIYNVVILMRLTIMQMIFKYVRLQDRDIQ